MYFELTEACSEEVARSIGQHSSEQVLLKVKDYTSETYRKKIAKKYGEHLNKTLNNKMFYVMSKSPEEIEQYIIGRFEAAIADTGRNK